MKQILESILKGFMQWIMDLCLEIVEYVADSLLDVFDMDLAYFRSVAPVTDDILKIIIAAGWALLLGNLVFQAVKSMASGLGFEGEDPKLLFTRTFVFSFLLLASQQICELGLGISGRVIDLLQIPSSVDFSFPDEGAFAIGASWLLVIIVSFVVMWQVIKLFLEIAERYVVTALLVLLSPLAFGMGGSKNTEDIFKGWCRMFGSMCLMMVLSVITLKLLLAAMSTSPTGVAVIPWMLLIIGIARVGRKVDGIVSRVGLNPAATGAGLGRSFPGMVAYAVVRNMGSTIVKSAAHSAGTGGKGGKSPGAGRSPGGPRPPTPRPRPSSGGAGSGGSARSPGGAGGLGGSGAPGASPASNPGTPPPAGGQQPQSGQENNPSGTQPSPGSGFSQGFGSGKRGNFGNSTGRRSSVPPAASGNTGFSGTGPRQASGGAAPSAQGQESSTASTQSDTSRTSTATHSASASRVGRPDLHHVHGSGGSASVQTVSTAGAQPGNSSGAPPGTAGSKKPPRPARPPVGGTPRPAPAGTGAANNAAPSGTAETHTEKSAATLQSTPLTGTAGKGHAPKASRPPIGGTPPLATGASPGNNAAPVPGGPAPSSTAGTAKAPRSGVSHVTSNTPGTQSGEQPGTAGTAKTSVSSTTRVTGGTPPITPVSTRSGGGSTSTHSTAAPGMAGTEQTPRPSRPPIGGQTPPPTPAGIRAETAKNAERGSTPPPGTAGKAKPAASTAPPPGTVVYQTGTAGTDRRTRSGESAGERKTPPPGSAATKQPPVRSTPPFDPKAREMAGSTRITQTEAKPEKNGGTSHTAAPAHMPKPLTPTADAGETGRRPQGGGSPAINRPPVTGTAGTEQPSRSMQSAGSRGTAPSGTAGTGRPATSITPPVTSGTPASGMAGTGAGPKSGPNKGTRRLSQPMTSTGGGSDKPSRRKGGDMNGK